MEGIRMKYDSDVAYSFSLPDAPLAMPKQKLERRRANGSIVVAWRSMISALPWF
jgi:hypothetical protein